MKSTARLEEALTDFVGDILAESGALDDKLEAAVSEALGNGTISADDIDGLDKYVENALSEFEVEAENVTDLEEMVESEVSKAIDHFQDNFKIDAESVEGFDERVAKVLDAREAARPEGIEDHRATDRFLEALQTPEVQAEIEKIVKKALGELLQKFLA